eukprot:TRINITY_DN105671_c0_g1_i1.p1 TRINITY_DN105671_c0_g1~~TRINITY_DN105671_c0_g1_i1.p1  ORF type:complete len:1772 (-),score=500.32 TRINITY_DN105671_c0_g1_i1:76-5391(-)
MSQLVLEWINDEVRLSRKVVTFEKDFANGYLFGELLHKHGLLNNFEDDFVDESSLNSKRSNFDFVKAAFRGGDATALGIKLTDAQVHEIMDEDRGSSLRLLYQLRRGLSGKARPQIEGHGSREEGGQKQFRIQKQVKGEDEEQFFDQRVKTLRPLHSRYPYEVHNKHFVDEHTKQLRTAREKESQALADKNRNVQNFRADRHQQMHNSKVAKEKAKAAGELHWQGVQERKYNMMEKDLLFEKEMIRRDHQRISDIKDHYAKDCGFADGDEENGIGWFERNLQRIGIDTSEHSGTNVASIEAASLKELHDKMQEKLPTKAQLQIESQKRMGKIKDKKKETDVARKERERRQRRVQLDQISTTAAVEEKKREDDLLAWLLTETEQYRQEADAYDLKLRRKEALWQQREAKQIAYAARAEQESEEAWSKMAEKARAERKLRLQQAASNVDADATHFPEDVSSDDGDDLDPMGNRMHTLSRGTNAQSKRSLNNSQTSLAFGGHDGQVAEAAESFEIASAEELTSCIRDPAVYDYLFSRGSWTRHKPSEEETLETVRRALNMLGETAEAASPHLGSVVQWLCKAPAKGLTEARLPPDYLPLVALTGSPGLCTGRGNPSALGSELANRVAQEFSYAVVKPQEVVEECVALASKPPQEPDWPILARMRELGGQITSSGSLDAKDYAEMIFRKIELLSAPAPKPVVEEDPKDKKKGKGKQQEEPPEPVRPSGIIILGYPSDLQQHVAWEAALRAFSSPMLQLLDDEESLQARLGTILAPYWVEDGLAAPVASAQAAPNLEDAQPVIPARVLRLSHPDEASLQSAILKEGTEEGAWEMAAVGAAAEEGVPPAPRCRGFEEELARATCPADRAWLYETAQVLARPAAEPLNCCHDLSAQDQTNGEETVPMQEALFQQVKDLIVSWQRPPPAEDAAAEGEAPAVEGEAEVAQEQEGGAGEEDEPKGDDEVAAPAAEADHTLMLDLESDTEHVEPLGKEGLRKHWLQGLSEYLLGVRSILAAVDEEAAKYAADIVQLQRRFLEFLQRPDEKAQVVEDFLKGFPLKSMSLAPPGSWQADELKEQIQELTDKLWICANYRRQEAVEERERLMTGGFWEEKAAIVTGLVHRLQALELSRFRLSAFVLKGTYLQDDQAAPTGTVPSTPESPPETLSSLEELAQWLDASAERVAAAEPSGVPELPAGASEAPVADFEGEEEDGSREATQSITQHGQSQKAVHSSELRAAIQAERLGLAQRCRAAAAWSFARLETMQKQYNEIFVRMDDWIKHRVKEENDAIRATAALLFTGKWEDEEPPMSPTATRKHRSTRKSLTSSLQAPMTSSTARRRRDVLKVIVPLTLDVDVYAPPKLDVCTEAHSRPSSRQGSAPSGAPGGRRMSSSTVAALPERWSQEMLWGILVRLLDLGAGSSGGVVSEASLLQILLERLHGALGYENEQVAPLPWVRRSEDVYKLLCRTMVEPAWGNCGIDVTEFMLVLIHHEYMLPWPTLEALGAARTFLESPEESGLDEDTLAAYPDIPVNEELFCKLPLWPECPQDLRQWIFQVLHCFSNEAQPSLPSKPRPSRDGMPNSSGSLTARRIFSYLGLGSAPADGFVRHTRLLLPASAFSEGEEQPQVLVQDLWAILFSQKSRPAAMLAPSPDLATFCEALAEEGKAAEAAVAAKAKAAPKAKGKKEEEVEEEPPKPPEEVTVAFSAQSILQRPTVLSGLCSHGALLCRRRGLEALFTQGGGFGPPLRTSAEALAVTELQSLVPSPPPTAADEGGNAT